MRAATSPAWVHDLTFVAAVALPEEWADEFGTTINGMWADPERWTPDAVAAAHEKGRRILVSVPLIALTHQVYERSETAGLLDEVCRDIDGTLAEVEWYYWDQKPVYSLCIHSPVVRSYLVDRLRPAIEAGVDVVNADEIMTSEGLMTRAPKGSGFCGRCLGGSRVLADAARARGVDGPTDDEARSWLREDLDLYRAFETEQQMRAYREADALLEELRSIARDANTQVAITANVAGLGAFVGNNGALWSAAWGELLDVIMLEASYVVPQSTSGDPWTHRLLPRGTLAPLYRLGRAIGPRAPIWISPHINVPRQLAGQRRQRYYELMFLEAYANAGRWGYNWWPGVDAATRREATAPDTIRDWTAFLRSHAELYTAIGTANDVAIVYVNGAVLERPITHFHYLAFAQALYEAGVQFDVVYTGDERFAPAPLDPADLARYDRVIVVGGDCLTTEQRTALDAVRSTGRTVVDIPGASATTDLLERFWVEYRDEDRDKILAACGIGARHRIESSARHVIPIRWIDATGRTLIHLVNVDYREATDEVPPARDARLRVPWSSPSVPGALLVSPAGERALDASVDGSVLELVVPEIREHAVIVLAREP